MCGDSHQKTVLFLSSMTASLIIMSIALGISRDRNPLSNKAIHETIEKGGVVHKATAIPDHSSGAISLDENDIILEYDNGHSATLAGFPDCTLLNDEDLGLADSKYLWRDMDGDGVPELLTSYFTGGAHCCWVFDLFQQISANTYRRIFSFEGGYAEIIRDQLEVYFQQQLGYFYTCYACNIDEELPNGRFEAHARLVYKNRALDYSEKDIHLNEIIFEDLEYLKNRAVPELDLFSYDDGTRKSYAEHLITYFFNNSLNIEETHAVFQDYYYGHDSIQVWQGIRGHLDNIWGMEYTTEEYVVGTKKLMEQIFHKKDSLKTDWRGCRPHRPRASR